MTAAPAHSLPLLPLHRDGRYVRTWCIGWLTGVVRWLELLAYGILAYELTGSPSLVALIALVRFAPMALLSQVIGAAADLVSLHRLLLWSLIGAIGVSIVMLAIQASGGLLYWHLCASAFCTGVYWASDMPIRRKILGQIAGEDRLARAMSWDYATSNGTRMVGPLIGGVLYQGIGMDGVLVIVLVHYLAALWLGSSLPRDEPKRSARPFRPSEVFFGAAEALRLALRNNDMVCIMSITVIFNLWGFPYVAMIPVIGEEHLDLGAASVGYLASIEGAASLLTVIVIGLVARKRSFRILYAAGAFGTLGAIALVGLTEGLGSMIFGLLLVGILTACFAAMQATLVYQAAPAEMRGRYLGLISFCIGAGAVGFANVGLTAEWFGARNAMWIIAAEGLVPAMVVLWRWRALHRDLGLVSR